LHANLLRKFHTQVNLITTNSVSCTPIDSCRLYGVETSGNIDTVSINCAVIFDNDVEFGDVSFIEPPQYLRQSLPSQRLASESHDRQQVLELLDKYPDVF
jgi:hypothetical protein